MSFFSDMSGLAKKVMLSFILMSVPTATLADEGTADKPEDWESRLEMLRSVSYISLSETIVDDGDSGVVFYNAEKAYNGYNLYCTRRSGEAFLLDMEGREVHRWMLKESGGSGSYHHVEMLPDGDLIAIIEHKKLFRINWNSELIWKRRLKAHHDVTQAADSSFYVVARELKDYKEYRVYFATILHVSADGEEMDKWSTYDHLAELKDVLDSRSFLETILDSIDAGRVPAGKTSASVKKAVKRRSGKVVPKVDHFHMNTIELLPATPWGETDSRFQEGNLLICFRNVNQIAVLEKGTYRVLWAWGEGELEWPHHPTMLPSGHILIFDNGVEHKRSRVIELDPSTGKIVWEYVASPPGDFFTSGGGSAQRLANGNTLVCETNKGRVFEVTSQGEVVWVWLNPATRKDRRETVYRMMRLPRSLVDPLLEQEEARHRNSFPGVVGIPPE